jgi:ABC-2 type transport system permease protein
MKWFKKSNQDLKLGLKASSDNFVGLFKLIGKAFYSDPRGPIFLYLVPILFMVLFYFVIGGTNPEAKVSLLFSYMLLPAMTILTALAPMLVEWKTSIFLRRIEMTGVKKSMFLLALWIFYFFAGLSGIALQFLVALSLGKKMLINYLPHVQWGYFFSGVFLTIILMIAIATFLGGLFSNEGALYGITMMIYFISIFLSGIMLYPKLYETNEVVRIFTYFIPQKYPSFLILLAQDSRGLNGYFNTANPAHPDFTAVWQMFVGSILFILAFFTVTNFTFKW